MSSFIPAIFLTIFLGGKLVGEGLVWAGFPLAVFGLGMLVRIVGRGERDA